MKYLVLTSLLAFIHLGQAMGQVAGYMGKRSTVGYSYIFSGSKLMENILVNGTEFSEYYDEIHLFSNRNHQFHFDYLITRHTAVGAYFSFWRKHQAAMPIVDQVYSPYYSTHNYGDNPVILEEGSNVHGEYRRYLSEGKGKLSGQGLGIYFKFFGKDPLAPLGNYFQMTFLVNRASAYREIQQTNDQTGGVTYQKMNTENIYVPAFIISFGKQWMIFDRVLINGAVETGLSFPVRVGGDRSLDYDYYYYSGSDNDPYEYEYNGPPYSDQERTKINIQHGLQLNYLMQFKLGISYLAF